MDTVPPRRLNPEIRLAPAKLNLTLAVLGRREDGFHALHSVMVPLALADRLSVAALPPGAEDTLHRTGFDAGPLADDLVLRAIRAAREAAPRVPGMPVPGPLAARLEKRIPVAAGLGGGSSDAAAALDAAIAAWGLELDPGRRRAVAAALGSDVPFFLVRGPALVEGRGERVTPLRWLGAGEPSPGVLLVTPGIPLATRDVFAAHAAGARAPGAARLVSEHLAAELGDGRLRTADLFARAAVLAGGNDLAPAADAVEPRLVAFRRALMRLLGRPVGLSGSGPTHWVLYPSLEAAAAAADQARAAAAAGTLVAPGDGPPTIIATTILGPDLAGSDGAQPAGGPR